MCRSATAAAIGATFSISFICTTINTRTSTSTIATSTATAIATSTSFAIITFYRTLCHTTISSFTRATCTTAATS